ncbi:MAG: hypothetical protein AAF403_07115, partial [Pseudomonadota bacterium]
MPYIGRNEKGEIVAMAREKTGSTPEYIQDNDPDLYNFFNSASSRVLRQLLLQSDQDMIELIDDLIHLLIKRNIIKITDFSESQQRRLYNRRILRKVLEN